MLILVKILLVACLGVVCYQDFRSRSFYWVLVPAILLLSAAQVALTMGSISWVVRMSAINAMLLGVLLLGMLLYILIRRGSLKGAVGREVGLGDLLLFAGVVPLFTPVMFIAILLASFVAGLLFHVGMLALGKPKSTIPLAGILAAICICYILVPAAFNFVLY